MENNFNKPPQEDSNKIPEEKNSISEKISQESNVDNEPFGHYSEAETKNTIERQNEEGEETTEKTPRHEEEQKPELSKETLLFTLDNFLNDITQQYEKVANYPPDEFSYNWGSSSLVVRFNKASSEMYKNESSDHFKDLNDAKKRKQKLVIKNQGKKGLFTSEAKFEARKNERKFEIEGLEDFIKKTDTAMENLYQTYESYKTAKKIPVPDNLRDLFIKMSESSMRHKSLSSPREVDSILTSGGAMKFKSNFKDLCTQLKEYAQVNLKDRV